MGEQGKILGRERGERGLGVKINFGVGLDRDGMTEKKGENDDGRGLVYSTTIPPPQKRFRCVFVGEH